VLAYLIRGCPPIHTLWMRGIAGDLWMLGGGLVIGIADGVGAGTWCARRPGTASARFVESVATLLFCAPVYVIGLGLLLLFNRDGRALDQDPNFPGIDVTMLKTISLWTALIIVVSSIAAVVVLAALDPRVRSAGRV
jgi:ABC-type dipeptide/oligopeptide/nickel transport system permease component